MESKRDIWWNVQHKSRFRGTWASTALFSRDRKYLLEFIKGINEAAKKRGDQDRDRVVRVREGGE
jgi:hypothetical protein